MTKQLPETDDSSGQAGAEIEITPAMIEAGAKVLENSFDATPSIALDTAAEVFRAMLAARR